MDKQNVIPYNGILCSHKKERSSDLGHHVGEPGKLCAKRKKPDIEGYILDDPVCVEGPEPQGQEVDE